jgi:ornithine cyclodeaminase/alanine dehydrogenase-like protein (mu-crystallin family)
MTAPHRFIYLSRADVEAAACPVSEIMAAVELAFREKAAARTIMQPKHWLAPSSRRFFSAMSSALPGVSAAGCKWQSGSPDNAASGRPYITGQYILNALDTGLPLAIMDSTWLTEVRTAAATAVVARHLLVGPPRTLAILGCGLQARRHLEALSHAFTSLKAVRCYDIVRETAEHFGCEMTQQYRLEATICESSRSAFEGADIIITCGPIAPDTPRLARAEWLDAGATAITIDYDCYWGRGELARVDQVFTDDVTQLEHSKPDGYFAGVPSTLQEVAGVIGGTSPGHKSPQSRIVCINMGIAIEDAASAVAIYRRARECGIGTELST